MRSLALPCCLAVLLAATGARADSPLTSSELWLGYEDLPAVQAALKAEAQADAVGPALEFLRTAAPSDQKVAVMFALAHAGQAHPAPFLEALAAQQKKPLARLREADLTPPERFVVGTLGALGSFDEAVPEKGTPPLLAVPPLRLLDAAAAALPQDFAVQYVRALARAQLAMAGPWCEVFRGPDAVLRRFPAGQRTLRPRALASATDYLALYEKECPGSLAGAREQLADLNRIYAVALVGGQVVTGAQSGLAAWQDGRREPLAVLTDVLCTSALAWHGAAFVACRDHLYRWDGRRFERLLALHGASDAYAQLVAGPDDALWVREGAHVWRWDEAKRALVPVKAPWPDDAYEVLLTPNGSAWWTGFLKGVGSTSGDFTLGSPALPAQDPRSPVVTADGTVWVMDFEVGLLRFDEQAWRFVRDPLVPAKAAGVVFDAAQKRYLALQYDRGLAVQRPRQAPLRVDLSRFEYLRTLALNPGGPLWVGSEKGLLRLEEREGAWSVEPFTVKTLPSGRK